MYLHLGQDVVVPMSEVVAIFDLETSTINSSTRNYLTMAEKNGRVVNVSAELPKSFVVCRSGGCTKVYISQISPATLKKRTAFLEGIDNAMERGNRTAREKGE